MASLGAKLFRNIADAVDAGDLVQAAEYQRVMIKIFDGIYGSALDTVWAGQKYALKLLNIFSTEKTLVPSQENALTEENRKRIEYCISTYRDYLV